MFDLFNCLKNRINQFLNLHNMISRLVIKNVASYDATGVDVDTNKKINFFFGYNGSGKSTIAKYLHNITLPTTEQSSDFVDCSQIGYDPLAQTILVYDEEFKKESEKYSHAKPFTKESLLYREIFEKYYSGQGDMIKDFWMPNKAWEGCNVNDPSARVLSNYGESGK